VSTARVPIGWAPGGGRGGGSRTAAPVWRTVACRRMARPRGSHAVRSRTGTLAGPGPVTLGTNVCIEDDGCLGTMRTGSVCQRLADLEASYTSYGGLLTPESGRVASRFTACYPPAGRFDKLKADCRTTPGFDYFDASEPCYTETKSVTTTGRRPTTRITKTTYRHGVCARPAAS